MNKITLLSFTLCLGLSASCSTSHDCSLNGECVDKKCTCDVPWKGEKCDVLTIGKAFDSYRNESEASWGGNIVHVNGTYHLFVAQMALSCGLDHWGTNSMIIRASSQNASGPYTFKDVVVQPFAHNPTIRRLPNDEGFVIFFIGGTVSNPWIVVTHTMHPPRCHRHHRWEVQFTLCFLNSSRALTANPYKSDSPRISLQLIWNGDPYVFNFFSIFLHKSLTLIIKAVCDKSQSICTSRWYCDTCVAARLQQKSR